MLNKKKKVNFDAAEQVETVNDCTQNLSKQHLEFCEENLDSETLEDFKNALENNTDISNSENKGLFIYWKTLKKRTG